MPKYQYRLNGETQNHLKGQFQAYPTFPQLPIQETVYQFQTERATSLPPVFYILHSPNHDSSRPNPFVHAFRVHNAQPSHSDSGLLSRAQDCSTPRLNPAAKDFVPRQSVAAEITEPRRPPAARGQAQKAINQIIQSRNYADLANPNLEPEYLTGQELFNQHQSNERVVCGLPSYAKYRLPNQTYTGSSGSGFQPLSRLWPEHQESSAKLDLTDSQIWAPPTNPADLVLQYLDARGLHSRDTLEAELRLVGLRL